MDKRPQTQAQSSNMVKDPDDWTTGDQPMTGAQKSYLDPVGRGGAIHARLHRKT